MRELIWAESGGRVAARDWRLRVLYASANGAREDKEDPEICNEEDQIQTDQRLRETLLCERQNVQQTKETSMTVQIWLRARQVSGQCTLCISRK